MKTHIISFSILLSLLLACESKKKNDLIGYYETQIGAASSPGRLIFLKIDTAQTAYFSVDYLNSTPEFVDTCSWKKLPNNQLEVSTMDEKMIFEQKENQLIYIGEEYGTDGLILTKKEEPIAEPKKLLAWIKKEEDTLYFDVGKIPVFEKLPYKIEKLPLEKIEESEIYAIWILRKPLSKGKYEYEFLEFAE